jgi:hypothetical protein
VEDLNRLVVGRELKMKVLVEKVGVEEEEDFVQVEA